MRLLTMCWSCCSHMQGPRTRDIAIGDDPADGQPARIVRRGDVFFVTCWEDKTCHALADFIPDWYGTMEERLNIHALVTKRSQMLQGDGINACIKRDLDHYHTGRDLSEITVDDILHLPTASSFHHVEGINHVWGGG